MASITCPVCSASLEGTEREVNNHIDECLTTQFLGEGGTRDSRGGGEDVEYIYDEELAHELADEGSYSAPSLQLNCPYPACGVQMDAMAFSNMRKHKTCNQQLSCPICYVETGIAYAVNESTNLMQHLSNAHADAAEVYRALQESRTAYTLHQTGRVQLPKTIGHSFTVQTLTCGMGDKECPICFEEFEKGHKVAWLECFCVFHEQCIDNWFKKVGSQDCPVHKDDNSTS